MVLVVGSKDSRLDVFAQATFVIVGKTAFLNNVCSSEPNPCQNCLLYRLLRDEGKHDMERQRGKPFGQIVMINMACAQSKLKARIDL